MTVPTPGHVDRATLVALHTAANPPTDPRSAPPLSERVLGLQDGHPIYRCDQCHGPDSPGDNHPKVHVNLDTPSEQHLHFDCVPKHAHYSYDPLHLKAIELALTGTHGDDLRAALAEHSAKPETVAELEAYRVAVMAANEAADTKASV